ncbi:flagellar basal-body rod protein FlgF [Aliiruegeria haliotis]|uniref:Flagellar basal-body rod protein FlgF n=1 Tax=Aliiruegeria haliotis TaxID=1280846 RepID=A0A2T0RTI2_9RHOB|nr:flagellar hook-basal body complex protein [Aliiruegeria haliotis]PRY24393.1 flagellar basal-body rod protein FlgF [Aliiruegeria haliotis]
MSSGYVTLSRQSGLMQEMRAIANNIANQSTSGFRREGIVFSEYIRQTPAASGSVSMAAANTRVIDLTQGQLEQTGGSLDVAIEGEGFFLLQSANGELLTRSGVFLPGDTGDLMTPGGNMVLDEGGAPIFIPPDARSISIATDGTISADGRPVARLGVVRPTDPLQLQRGEGTTFHSPSGVEPVEDAVVMQGFVEASNIDPVLEITRMIEVQRAYELGQAFSEREGKRLSNVIDTLTR